MESYMTLVKYNFPFKPMEKLDLSMFWIGRWVCVEGLKVHILGLFGSLIYQGSRLHPMFTLGDVGECDHAHVPIV
jgi:hypothetical protein